MIERLRDAISPTIVLCLTVLWLILQQTVAPDQILLGALAAVLLTWASSQLRPLRAHVRRIDLAAGLFLIVLWEIIQSNIAVSRIVLGLVRKREVRSGFVRIPLELRDPHGLAALAAIITATPGTVWAGLAADGKYLTLHILDIEDEAQWIRYIKDRFERPLMRIFE
jgi:multicomponent K+:H+ antiporter subunit E